MTFGVCARIEEAESVLAAGFDYLEVPANGLNGLEATWDPSLYAGVPILATNLFFDPSLTLHDRGRQLYWSYVERTIERAALIGARTMVVGSGRARRSPDGIDGEARFVEAVIELQAVANRYGIRIAPESLNRDETNVGNSLVALSLALNAVGVGHTSDSYYILREWDADGRYCSIPILYQGELQIAPTHVHLGPMDRGMPDARDPMLRDFAGVVVRDLEYDGPVSLEVDRGPEFDLSAANAAVRALFSPESIAKASPPPRVRIRDGVAVYE